MATPPPAATAARSRAQPLPAGLAQIDLDAWIRATSLTSEQIHTAWRLAAFLEAQARAGRDKITLLLNDDWAGAALWTKQDFEESLARAKRRPQNRHWRETQTGELPSSQGPCSGPRLPGHPDSRAKGPDAEKVALLRRKGYPVAVVKFPAVPLSAYMQFMHYVVFGLAYLRNMNFVTQPASNSTRPSPIAC